MQQVAKAEAPDVWTALSPRARAEVVAMTAGESELFIHELLKALQSQVRHALAHTSRTTASCCTGERSMYTPLEDYTDPLLVSRWIVSHTCKTVEQSRAGAAGA